MVKTVIATLLALCILALPLREALGQGDGSQNDDIQAAVAVAEEEWVRKVQQMQESDA